MLYQGVLDANEQVIELGGQLVGMPFGFVFGERLYLGLKGGAK
jgi:hypothetical protein